MDITQRFIEYAKIYTESDPNSQSYPSSQRQFELANLLVKQCKEMGLTEVNLDKYGYVTATLEANTQKNIRTLGLLAHMDTAPAFTGENVNPKIVKNYDGKDIILNQEENIILSPKDFPELLEVKGLDLVVTDGKTLLGADDKAGIAIIMDVLNKLKENPQIKHGKIRIAFTPDEEIGKGVEYFNVENFGADVAFTLDGSKLGEVQYECFNAFGAKVKIQGKSVHPGSAKNKMVNAISLAMELDSMLPQDARPQNTEGYEGFYHLDEIQGTVDQCQMEYILRDFDYSKILEMKKLFEDAVDFLNRKYGNRIQVEIKESYRNMKEKVSEHMDLIDLAVSTMKEMDIEPIIEPIRGGTDGSSLSWMGLPTPNLFTGGMNFHGQYEYIPVQHMEKSRDFLLKLIENMEKQA